MNRRSLALACLGVLLASSGCDCGGDGGGGPGSDGQAGGDGQDGESGNDGADGVDGVDGVDGQQGEPGPIGPPGEDASELLIVRLDADDVPGTNADRAVTATFAGDVTLLEERLTDASLTLRYARRSAPELVRGSLGSGCGVDGVCLWQQNGARVLDLDGDIDGSGFLESGASFHLMFDQRMASDTADRLGAWINGSLGIPDAIVVYPVDFFDPLSRAYAFEALLDVAITSFSSTGANVGLPVTLPAFTVQDAFGDGNAATVLTLHDGATLDAQAEPTGRPFDPATDNVGNAVAEDGRYAVGDSFILTFERAMDPFSTMAAIKARLEGSGVWSRVDVSAMQGTSFPVTVLDEAVDLTSTGGRHTLVLDPWDVTSDWGISNTNLPIEFVITDITVPRLAVQGSSSTLAILLATNVPDRASNDEVREGDTLQVVFSEPMTDELVRDDLLRLLQAAGLSATLVDVQGSGTTFSYTLKSGDSLTVAGAELDVGLLDSSSIDDANGTALATQQRLRAIKSEWMVPPTITDGDASGAVTTLQVTLGSASREDEVLEAGDTLGVVFSKSMDGTTTGLAVATAFATAVITGANRGGAWDAGAVRDGLDISTTLNSDDTFRYTLSGDQTITPTGDTVDLGALGGAVLDINGLRLPVSDRLVAPRAAFDPREAPSLSSIRAAATLSAPCGDARLQGGDQLQFRFSEAIHPTVTPSLAGEIAAKVDAQASGSAVQLGHVDASANPLFVVTLPQGAQLQISAAITFALDRTQIVDVNGVVAPDAAAATARLEAGDFLTLQGAITSQAVVHDGVLASGDSVGLFFGCVMDNFHTLSSLQEAVDTLMGDGTARVTTADNVHYAVTILPGRQFDVSTPKTLEVFGVASDENLNDPDNPPTPIAGPLRITLLDAVVGDAVLTYEPSSAAGQRARFVTNTALTSGIWVLDAVSAGLSRAELELPLVFSSWVAPNGPVCGDFVVEDGEACDPPEPGICNEACLIVPASCGDSVVQPGEHCDPPNVDGCGSDCLYPGVPPAWTCSPTWYGGADGCDCGCGAVDSDCADATEDSCDWCVCDGAACDPVDNSQCVP